MTSANTTTSDLSRLAGTWKLDAVKTSVTFRTKALWFLPVKGTAKAYDGTAKLGPGSAVEGSLAIDASSFDTKNRKRDDHLRSEHFLDVVKYPTIVFTATSGRIIAAGRIEITGALTAHGRSMPLILQDDVSGSDSSATVSAEVEIDRSLWGMSWTKMGARLKNRVTIRAHFIRA